MDTKWKKITVEKKKAGAWALTAVFAMLFFGGIVFGNSNGFTLGNFSLELFPGDYLESERFRWHCEAIHEEVVRELRNDRNRAVNDGDWFFQGKYEYIQTSIGGTVKKHKSNIPVNYYRVGEREVAEAYFKDVSLCPAYYIWDGLKYQMSRQIEQSEGLSDFLSQHPLNADERLAIGFHTQWVDGQQAQMNTECFQAWGCFLMIAVGLVGMFLTQGMAHFGKKAVFQGLPYMDMLLAAGILDLIVLYVFTMSLAYSWGEPVCIWLILVLGASGAFLPYGLFSFLKNAAAVRRGGKEELRQQFYGKIAWRKLCGFLAGKNWKDLGIQACCEKRQQFMRRISVGTAAFMAVMGMIHFLISSYDGVWRGESFAVTVFLDILAFFLLLLAWRAYRQGTKELGKEYGRWLSQMDEITHGSYQNHTLLPEDSVFYRESVRMSMLGNELQSQVEKRVQAEKMKIDLITNVSHDLKTPLTSIISYIELLKDEELSPAARDYVGVLEKKSARLKKMINDTFDLSKASSGSMNVKKENVDLWKLLEQTIGDMAMEIEKAPVKVVTKLEADSAVIRNDGQLLYRILQNLMQNALCYSMPGTRVYVTLKGRDKEIVIRVKNVSGYEMDFTPEEVLGRFFRGSKSRNGEGSGLGLAIAREFAELCGGRLEVQIDGDVFCAELRLKM